MLLAWEYSLKLEPHSRTLNHVQMFSINGLKLQPSLVYSVVDLVCTGHLNFSLQVSHFSPSPGASGPGMGEHFGCPFIPPPEPKAVGGRGN